MKISSKTKISVIIKHNKEAIEAIASVNPHFTKLRNPILRSVLAPRVTVEDAARIGKCNVSDLMDKLSAIGFEIENEIQKTEQMQIEELSKEIAAHLNAGKIKSLDVRPILSSGTDPFNRIMEELKQVPDGIVLEIINSFEPTPLIKILNNKGYISSVKNEGDIIRTYFLKKGTGAKAESSGEAVIKVSASEMEKEKGIFKDKIREIDVRDLEMPLPMVTILNELESLPKDGALYVHHKKVPQFLLPELSERRFRAWINEIEEGNVKMLIHH